MKKFILVLSAILLVSFVSAQTSNQAIYPDGHGGFVYMPNGKISFADEIVELVEGTPQCEAVNNGGAKEVILGEANYNIETRKGFFTIGCGGSITVRFTDNALTDIEGPDLYIFEVGSEIENTQLEISKDGVTWITVGEISGGRAEVDIKDFVKPNEVFYYVRLTDLKTSCAGSFPGADIDAIAALGSVMQVTLNSSVLFDAGSYTLKPSALSAIDSLVMNLDASSIRAVDIYGHTDSDGSDEMNLTLSKNRANAVKDYILKKIKDKSVIVNTIGKGETEPVASNDTEEGKSSNRRVSMIIYPKTVNKVNRKEYDEFTKVLCNPFDITRGRSFHKYPRPINQTAMEGMFETHIDDVLYMDGTSYFFSGNKVRTFDHKTKTVNAQDKKIADVFSGLKLNSIDASFYLVEEKKYCFMKNDTAILFDPLNKTYKNYQLEKLFPGLSTKRPEAVLYYGEHNYIFYYEGYRQWYNYQTHVAKTPVLIKTEPWGNLWMDGVDGIMDDGTGLIYFFKNPID